MPEETEDEQAKIREVMGILGRRNSERKIANARAVAEGRRGKPLPEETKAKLREAQRARREREHAEALARGDIVEVEKYTRPKKKQAAKPTEASQTPDAGAQREEPVNLREEIE